MGDSPHHSQALSKPKANSHPVATLQLRGAHKALPVLRRKDPVKASPRVLAVGWGRLLGGHVPLARETRPMGLGISSVWTPVRYQSRTFPKLRSA